MPFHHHAHMRDLPLLKAGQKVARGQLLGYVGKSGTSYAHDHYEVSKNAPPHWNFYPSGYPKQYVIDRYLDPRRYIDESANLPCRWGNKNAGLKFLEYYAGHNVYHPGIDINDGSGDQDLGNELRSTTDGIVRYAGNATGWGNHIWIEETINQKTMIKRIRHKGTEYLSFNDVEVWGIVDPAFAKFLESCGIPVVDVEVLPGKYTHNISMPRWTIERAK